MPYLLSRSWPWLAGAGVVASSLGAGLLHQPLVVMRGMLLIVGVGLLLLGLATLGMSQQQQQRTQQSTNILYGAGFCVLLGAMSLIIAVLPVIVLAYTFAAQFLVAGVMQLGIASDFRTSSLALATILAVCAVMCLVLGVFLILTPVAAFLALLSFCGTCFLTCGLVALMISVCLVSPV